MKLSSFSFGSPLERLRHSWRRDPARDWFMLLGFAALFFSVILVWNMWLFDTVSRGDVIGSAPAPTPTALGSTSLGTVQAVFASRAAEESKYAGGIYHFTDPSQ